MTRDEDHLTSDITDCLVMLLQQRDAMGRTKYGKTLDRDDLTPEQWAQHMAEELLDGAGYAMAYAREVAKMRTERDALLTVRETLRRECEALRRECEALEAELSAAKAEAEALRKDAERYRWLRDKANDAAGRAPMVFVCDPADPLRWTDARHSDELDAAIDAAIAAQGGAK